MWAALIDGRWGELHFKSKKTVYEKNEGVDENGENGALSRAEQRVPFTATTFQLSLWKTMNRGKTSLFPNRNSNFNHHYFHLYLLSNTPIKIPGNKHRHLH